MNARKNILKINIYYLVKQSECMINFITLKLVIILHSFFFSFVI